MLRQDYGCLTAAEALDEAIKAEQICKDLGPFDPAFTYFGRERLAYETMAVLLEKEANEL